MATRLRKRSPRSWGGKKKTLSEKTEAAKILSNREPDLPQSVPSPLPLDSGDVSISSGLDRKSKPFSASSVSGSSLVSMLAGVVVEEEEEEDGFFLRICRRRETNG